MSRSVIRLLWALFVGCVCILSACKDQNEVIHEPEPDRPAAVKPKYLWFDASANFQRFSHIDSIQYYLDKCVEIGITDLVIDVRPVSGDVLYESNIVEQLVTWKGYHRETDWDYLDVLIREGHQRNLRVHASINVFSGGHNYFDAGVVYRDPAFAELTTLLNKPEGLVDIKTQKSQYAAFFNPTNPKVQDYCISIIEELVAGYELDGIILDRCRFDGLDSDFSPLSRQLFETYIGQPLARFPADIFRWEKLNNGDWGREAGPFYPKWLEWRAKMIHDFFALARERVKKLKPEIDFGTYTGAWYPSYFEFGVNWASKKYNPQNDDYINWMFTDRYKNFGYADLLDTYMTGVYYTQVYGPGWYTIEGGLWKAKVLTKGDVPVIGSLYADLYKTNGGDLIDAVELCLVLSDGLMIFDIVQVIEYDLWDEIETGVRKSNKEN